MGIMAIRFLVMIGMLTLVSIGGTWTRMITRLAVALTLISIKWICASATPNTRWQWELSGTIIYLIMHYGIISTILFITLILTEFVCVPETTKATTVAESTQKGIRTIARSVCAVTMQEKRTTKILWIAVL